MKNQEFTLKLKVLNNNLYLYLKSEDINLNGVKFDFDPKLINVYVNEMIDKIKWI